jgi:hypothetical protein
MVLKFSSEHFCCLPVTTHELQLLFMDLSEQLNVEILVCTFVRVWLRLKQAVPPFFLLMTWYQNFLSALLSNTLRWTSCVVIFYLLMLGCVLYKRVLLVGKVTVVIKYVWIYTECHTLCASSVISRYAVHERVWAVDVAKTRLILYWTHFSFSYPLLTKIALSFKLTEQIVALRFASTCLNCIRLACNLLRILILNL